jgi:hypothetical protein
MIDPNAGADARLSAFAEDQELLAEIPAGIGDLLHDRARERYLRRVWQTAFIVALVILLVTNAPMLSLTSSERIVGVFVGLAILGYLAYGFTWKWPERWEHQLLLEEIEHRRRLGKWRWER